MSTRTEIERFIAIEKVLIQVNYKQINEMDLSFAIHRELLFGVNLFVEFEDLKRQLVFVRGVQTHRIRRNQLLFK